MRRRDFLRFTGAGLALGRMPRCFRATTRAIAPRDGAEEPIDRRARVARHSPVVRVFDSFSALSVGNGGFAFTADATGLQTFPERYRELPLATQAEWGWHTEPNIGGYKIEDASVLYDAHGRQVPYASKQNGSAGTWLRENPRRISLARVGFLLTRADGTPAQAADLAAVEQRLDLWSGTIDSRFTLDGRVVRVRTWAHPERDQIAVRVESAGLDPSWIAVRIMFPFVSATHTGDPADWLHDARHRTIILDRARRSVTWQRVLGGDGYWARAAWSDGGSMTQVGPHEFRLDPAAGSSRFECVVGFSRERDRTAMPEVDATASASEAHWTRFWSDGGTLDLSGSADPRATELERRIVLSEYLTAMQQRGHHAAAGDGRDIQQLVRQGAPRDALVARGALRTVESRRDARAQPAVVRAHPAGGARERGAPGLAGRAVAEDGGPDGRDSPSSVGVFLVWQQPHPIYLSELVMASASRSSHAGALSRDRVRVGRVHGVLPVLGCGRGRYVLGPPLIPAQESHPPATTFNPTFELAYWAFGLETAQRWRERLGLSREPSWDRVLHGLSALPMRDGLYVNTESAPTTFTDADQRRDHPTLLGAYGFVGSPRVDREAMRRTLRRVMESWQWADTWGWDYPLVAMTATRLGEPELAIDALLMETPKNRYHPTATTISARG